MIVENVGNVLLQLGDSILRVQLILPLPDYVVNGIREGGGPVDNEQTEVQWAEIVSRERDLSQLPVQLEPGESDEIIYDFIFDDEFQTVKIYTHYSSACIGLHLPFFKKGGTLGWKRTTIYDIH